MPKDIAVRASLGQNRDIVRWFGGDIESDKSLSEEQARDHLHQRFGRGPHWVMADQSDRFIGVARLAPLDVESRSAKFAIGIFDPNRLGEGLGTEGTRLAITYGFEHLDLTEITLTVLAENERAITAYKKCGFREAGRTPEALHRDGRWYEDLHMRITNTDDR